MAPTAPGAGETSVSGYWHWQLENWARWVNGLDLPYLARSGQIATENFTPDERAAQRTELLLVRMKARQPRYYRALRECYLRRRDNITASEVLRCSVATYEGRIAAAYRWLDLVDRE